MKGLTRSVHLIIMKIFPSQKTSKTKQIKISTYISSKIMLLCIVSFFFVVSMRYSEILPMQKTTFIEQIVQFYKPL